jgi:signal transduction histidine kinase
MRRRSGGVARRVAQRSPAYKAARRRAVEAASHDLRTPLASVIAALELLRDGARPHGIDTTSSFAGLALESAYRLEQALERWLEAARLDLG